MSEPPVCGKCGTAHWRFHPCPVGAPASTSRLFVVRRPREGYREFGDVLEPDTVRMGASTIARRRNPGEQPGSFRAA